MKRERSSFVVISSETALLPTYYTYDSMGNVINMKQGLATDDDPQININYEYDSAGQLVKTTQGTHVTTYEYDTAGRLKKMTDPMGYTESYTYDTSGNVKTSTDKNGVVTTNTYNNRGLLSKTVKGTEYIEYTYDAVGNILTSKDKNGIISYTYNYDGTPATKTYPDGKSITYNTYNANKALTAMTDYLGNTTTYTYNSKGAVTAIGEMYSGTTSNKTTSYAYNTDGSLQKVTYPLSSYMTTTYTYDYAGRVSNLTNKLTSSSTYSTHAYTYDNSGNITQKVENIQGTSTTTSYIYDSFNRLLREDIGGTSNVYHYDQYGNLSTSDFNEVLYFYDANNRLTSIEEYGKTRDTEDGEKYDDWYTYLAYDKNGNLLRSETDACTTPYESSNYKTYTYDTWGRLTNFSDTLGESASYTYYSDGLRASKTVGTDVTKYYYNGDNVINETLNGNSYATNVLGVNGYISRQQNGTIGYLFKNAHGDVISAYSSTTNKLADYTYDAWGEHRTETETTSFTNNPLRYAGQYYDYESGMTYLRARYYDSSIRRFISEDPIRDGLNWYAYCSNNPVMFVDPSGLEISVDENTAENYVNTDNEDEETYIEALERYFNELSDDVIKYNYETGKFEIVEYRNYNNYNSTYLVRNLIKSDVKIIFQYVSGANGAGVLQTDADGSQTINIRFDTKKDFSTEPTGYVMDKNGNIYYEDSSDPIIVFAHELSHALDKTYGLSYAEDTTMVMLTGVPNSMTAPLCEAYNVGYVYVNETGGVVKPVSGICENAIRKERDGTQRLSGPINIQ